MDLPGDGSARACEGGGPGTVLNCLSSREFCGFYAQRCTQNAQRCIQATTSSKDPAGEKKLPKRQRPPIAAANLEVPSIRRVDTLWGTDIR